jgi:large subunit ribosomal protein L4
MAEKKSVSVKVLNMAGEEVSKMNLNAEVFGIEPHQQAMFDAVQVEQANQRQATAKTKVRHEVSGGGKKPWRQKGTGRARSGSSRSPVWVGGGTVFGPIGNQNYKISQNKKEHKLALKSALSLKTKDGLVVVDEIKFDEKKTKNFVNFLEALKVGTKALVVVDEITEEIFASARNVGYAKVVTSDNVSVVDLLNVDNLVISKASVKAIEEALK